LFLLILDNGEVYDRDVIPPGSQASPIYSSSENEDEGKCTFALHNAYIDKKYKDERFSTTSVSASQLLSDLHWLPICK